eukprot:Gb_18685 [translate_table: standard]
MLKHKAYRPQQCPPPSLRTQDPYHTKGHASTIPSRISKIVLTSESPLAASPQLGRRKDARSNFTASRQVQTSSAISLGLPMERKPSNRARPSAGTAKRASSAKEASEKSLRFSKQPFP